MRCPECEVLLQRRLDGEAVADGATLDKHLAECADCRERFYSATRLLEEALPALQRTGSPSVDWTDRTIAALLSDYRRRRWRFYRRTALATAAGVLLAILAGWYGTQVLQPHGPKQGVQARNELKPEGPSEKTAEPTLPQTVAEAEAAVKSLSNRIAENTVEQVRTLLAVSTTADMGPMPTLPTAAAIEEPLDPATRSLQETGRGVSTGLQTVANSARRAFDFLLRELPPVAR